jgi:two-component system nitrate/nitrite response regulator NarL
MSAVRVLIADDHPPTRAGVRSILESASFEIVAEASDAASAVAAARREQPDVCLLDIHMPGNGISAASDIALAAPNAAVVMLTVSRNDEDLFDALRAGAVGYLLKDTDPERLGPALNGVLAGEAALPRTLVSRLISEFQDRSHRRVPLLKKQTGSRLTSREWQVLELMREGLSTSEMAERMFVSAVTVRTHVSGILKKLQVPDRDAAVRLFQDAR